MKKEEIAKSILYTIAAAGIVVVAITAPNIIGVFGRYARTKRYNNKQLYSSLNRLERNKLISVSKGSNGLTFKLTKYGNDKLSKYKLDELFIQKPKKWDKKWRIVIFDIPEKFKNSRDYFVKKLKELGFAQIQKSVWICPYPCKDIIDFLKEVYFIKQFVRIVTAESIESESDLKNRFSLSG